MKSLLIFFMTAFFAVSSFAKTEISSFKTATNQTVMLGNSLTQLISRTGQSPSAIKTVAWQNNHGDTVQALQYDYNIGTSIYTITVFEEKIYKIQRRSNL